MSEAGSARNGWRLIGATVRLRKWQLAAGVAVGLLWTGAKVSTGVIIGNGIDQGVEGDDMTALRHWALLLALVAVLTGLFTGFRRYLAFREARWGEAHLRDRLFSHLQRLHFGFYDRTQVGQLMSRANTDLQQVQGLIVLLPITFSNGVTVVAVTVILLTIDPWLTLLALGSLPMLNVLATRFSRRLHPHVMGIQRELAELAAVVEESVAGVRVIKGLGAEQVQAARLQAEADDVYRESIGAATTRSRYIPALEVMPNLGLIAVLGFGGHRVLEGALTIGELIAFNVYIAMLIWPLRMLGMIVAQAQRAAVSAERVHEVLATEPAIVDPPRPRRPDRLHGELRFEQVRFGYGPGAPVLDELDLTVAAGESVALVGTTGSGKSTVGRLIPRFYDVDSGRVRLDGVDVREMGLGELRRAVGVVFEDTVLFSETIGGNIAFGVPDASREQVERAARLSGAHEFVSRLENGYDTELGERGYSLSGGQRQRIAIARAVLTDPRVLILDDATSAVDASKEHEIRGALLEVMRGRTTIVIAHRPATIALADRVVLLEEGRVVAVDTHSELLASEERYRAVLAAAAPEVSAETTEAAESADGAERAERADDHGRAGGGSDELAAGSGRSGR